ncbi:hypothetical protein DPMN_162981, partial [Dreissena polymorpha]
MPNPDMSQKTSRENTIEHPVKRTASIKSSISPRDQTTEQKGQEVKRSASIKSSISGREQANEQMGHDLNSTSSKSSFKKLIKQSTVDGDKRRDMLKQESKDSGIVTDTSVRPKDTGTKNRRSLKSKNSSDKVKRSQSMKDKRPKEQFDGKERSHDDSEIELLSPKQNGAPEDEQEKKNPSTIRGMWKKAFKTLKSSSSVEKLSKKSSFSKKKQNSKEADEEVEQLNSPVDPVYSLLKCAADLPRSGGKSPCLLHAHCSGQHTPSNPGNARYPSGGDSSGNTSKASSPSSS